MTPTTQQQHAAAQALATLRAERAATQETPLTLAILAAILDAARPEAAALKIGRLAPRRRDDHRP